jgi:hypothetical protein
MLRSSTLITIVFAVLSVAPFVLVKVYITLTGDTNAVWYLVHYSWIILLLWTLFGISVLYCGAQFVIKRRHVDSRDMSKEPKRGENISLSRDDENPYKSPRI